MINLQKIFWSAETSLYKFEEIKYIKNNKKWFVFILYMRKKNRGARTLNHNKEPPLVLILHWI